MRRLLRKFAISPLDDRYFAKLTQVDRNFSEKNLMNRRVEIEVKWLEFLLERNIIKDRNGQLAEGIQRFSQFTDDDFCRIKSAEALTNHDVKAVEYFIRDRLEKAGVEPALLEAVHFLLTSEDINNLSYALMFRGLKEKILLPSMREVLATLREKALAWRAIPLLSRTHGQPATPTTVGKELANFAYRMYQPYARLKQLPLRGKLNGAVGNFNSHRVVLPEVDWPRVSAEFISGKLGLAPNPFTTQIEPHDFLVDHFAELAKFNTMGIGLAQDAWSYISREQFVLAAKEKEVGSSIMPHKVNPIDFENAEGNFGVANALLEFFVRKLPVSRLQRDLSDSTVLRNIGVAAGHALLAQTSLRDGLGKLRPNEPRLRAELDAHWEVLAEPLQQLLRFAGVSDGYEKLKQLTRGKEVSRETIQGFIAGLELPEELKQRMRQLAPAGFLGFAGELVGALHELDLD